MSDRRPFVGGNWKMNTDRAAGAELARGVAGGLMNTDGCEVVVYPPLPYLLSTRSILRDRGSSIILGAQNAYSAPDGAFTGEVSIAMLKDCGVASVIIGHSERRHVLHEKDDLINAKARAVLEAGLQCVLCVGETLEQREAGHTDPVNQRQVRAGLADIPGDLVHSLVVAYEPVWAIGTGRTATPDDAQDVHRKLRNLVGSLYGAETAKQTRIIYGGSVKPGNAAELFSMPDIDGGLIGGASLKSTDFVTITKAAIQGAKAKHASTPT